MAKGLVLGHGALSELGAKHTSRKVRPRTGAVLTLRTKAADRLTRTVIGTDPKR